VPKYITAEQEEIQYRMQQLFNEFYHAGISELMARPYEQQASSARRDDAAGGNHEHKD